MSTDFGSLRVFENGETLDAGNADATWYAATRVAGGLAVADGTTQFPTINNRSMLCRVLHCVNVRKPSSGVTVLELDSSADWRDRVMWVSALIVTTQVYAGSSIGSDLNGGAGSIFGFTGAGCDPTDTTKPDYGIPIKVPSTATAWIFADEDSGALKLAVPSNCDDAILSTALSVCASPILDSGRHPSPPSPESPPSATNGSAVRAYHLNWLQDHAVQSQATGPDCVPLGPVKFGEVPVAEEWAVHGEEKRQPLNGQAWRWFIAEVSNGDGCTLDDSIDWRDRHISLTVAQQDVAADFTPGQANDDELALDDAADGTYAGCFYSGPGSPSNGSGSWSRTVSDVRYAADAETGELFVYNNSGTDLVVGGWVMASPQLGPYTENR